MRARENAALVVSVAAFAACACTLDPAPPSPARDDQLDQSGFVVVVADGGTATPTATIDLEPPAHLLGTTVDPFHRTEPCPEACAEGKACCGKTLTCVPIDCRECCPLPEFGFDTIAPR